MPLKTLYDLGYLNKEDARAHAFIFREAFNAHLDYDRIIELLTKAKDPKTRKYIFRPDRQNVENREVHATSTFHLLTKHGVLEPVPVPGRPREYTYRVHPAFIKDAGKAIQKHVTKKWYSRTKGDFMMER